jgi:hypothetical protein
MASNLATIRVELIANAQKFKTNIEKAQKPLNDLTKATAKTTKGSKGMQEQMRNLSGSIAAVQGPLGPVAGRISAIGAIMGRVSIAGLLLTGGLVALGAGFAKMVKSGSNAESQFLKLEALLKATGGASQQTSADIEQMAIQIGQGTLASVQGVRDAAGVLLTFKSISGDTFKEVLSLSQDLAAVGFGSVKTAALQLGKALEEPEIGLSALRRVGVSFSEQQKEQIKVMSLTGRQAEAQALILKALKEQVGGAGEGAAGGLAGAFDTLGENITLFFEQSAIASGTISLLTSAVQGLADAIGYFVNEIDPLEEGLRHLNTGYEESEKVIKKNLKEINLLEVANSKLTSVISMQRGENNRAIETMEKEIEMHTTMNKERAKKIAFHLTEIEVINKTNELADKTVDALIRQNKNELLLADSYGVSTDFLKLKIELEKKLRSSLGEGEIATEAITEAVKARTMAMMEQAVEQRNALLMIKNARSEDDSDDKRLRTQKQEIENLKANAKQRAILNAIRAEENRLRGLLGDLDPIERERQINELIKERIPLLTKQTEEFFGLEEELKKINTIAEGVGGAFDEAGNKIVDAFLRGKVASLDFKDILRELIIQIQKTIIQTLILDQVNSFVKGAIKGIFAPTTGTNVGAHGGSAGGGTVQQGRPELVGERGPELFVPNSSGSIKTNADTKSAMSGGGGVSITQNLNFAVGITNTVRAEVMNMLPSIQQSTINAVADAKQRGGKFSKAFGS